MKIATFNANSIRKRLPIIKDWLRHHKPDILCIQETKVQDTEFPLGEFPDTGYSVVFRGMKSYNGVALLSRTKPERVSYGLQDGPEPDEPRLLHAVIQGLPIVNTYIPQGYLIDSPKYQYKLEWFKRLRAYFEKNLSPGEPAIWCGDMNVAPEPMDVHHPEDHEDHVCFHKAAREAYASTRAWGFFDTFRALYPDKQQFTFWDYRQPNAFAANRGWRIDHILATPPLLKQCRRVAVDMEARQAEQPSDHTFLYAEFS